MKVHIDSDEWFPVYSLHPSAGPECDVSPETVERWKKVHDDFEQTQSEMQQVYKKNIDSAPHLQGPPPE